jgi:SPP1 gp7 family putative phage head morphogenesis protein
MADVGAESQLFAVEETLDELKALAPGFRRAAIALPVEEIAVFRGLVPDVERSLLRRYRLQSANYAIETIGAVETELARGLALGRTLQENMDAIQPLIQGTEYQAERIVRTEMLEAHTRTSQEAMKEIAKDVPALRQQWYTAGTARVCDLCDGLHGKVREFGKPFGKKRERGKFVEIMKPPAHPNCMCVVTPWHAEWTREEAEAVAEEVPARAGD